jgi:hypothetical protein
MFLSGLDRNRNPGRDLNFPKSILAPRDYSTVPKYESPQFRSHSLPLSLPSQEMIICQQATLVTADDGTGSRSNSTISTICQIWLCVASSIRYTSRVTRFCGKQRQNASVTPSGRSSRPPQPAWLCLHCKCRPSILWLSVAERLGLEW